MKGNQMFLRPNLLRTLLILVLTTAPFLWMSAQLNINTNKTTLGTVINQIKAQTKMQFFYDDAVASMPVPAVNLKNVSVSEALNKILQGKNVSYKIEDNIVYLKVKSSSKSANGKKVIGNVAAHQVSGCIVDENGEPLIGVSVLVKGTTTGVATDLDGNFTVSLKGNDDVLQVSYIGYETQEIKANGQSKLDIKMTTNSRSLDEVVVTALGIKREKKMLGYAIQEIKSDELNTTGDSQVSSALQGKVAGVSVNTSSTGLGGSAKITIRGNSSLSDNNQPLWIVDGVPFTENSSSSASVYGGIDRGSTSFDINPEDIESISVLKGPNAAALYGSRAGNGVILVTTKKGNKKNGIGVNYSGTCTWTTIADELERQTTYGQGSDGVYSSKSQFSFGAKLDGSMQEAWNGEMIPYSYYGNKTKDYFNTGFSQNHNVSVGRQKEDSHFRASFGYSDSKGMFKDESLRKINIDLNTGMKLTNYLSMDAKISLSNAKAENRPYFGLYGEVAQLLLVPNNVRLEDLSHYSTDQKMHVNWVGPTTDYLNPYYVNQQRRNSDDRWRAFGYYGMKADFTDWLHFSAKYSFDYYRTKLFSGDLSNGTKVDSILDVLEDNMNRSEENFFEQNAEFVLLGNNTVADALRIGYTLGGNLMYSKYNNIGVEVNNMVYKNQWMLGHAHQLNTANESGWQRATNSIFGSLQLSYNEYLSLDLTARNDWSSTLPAKNNSYFYPSANLVYLFNDFAKSRGISLPSWLTFSKLRLSAAMVGKDADPFSTYNVISGGYNVGVYNPQISFLKKNDQLKNEIAVSYEAGLDMKFFDNRFGFDFTYYYGYTKNQIMVIPAKAPWVDGEIINSGLIVNQGVEAMLYATLVKTKDFSFDLDLNLAHNSSTVKELNDNKKFVYFSGDSKFPVQVGAREGGKLGEIYARTQYLRDDNGNLIINKATGRPEKTSDEQANLDNPIGCIQPSLLMSVTPRLSYKGISLSALFDMKFGGDIVSVSEAMATFHGVSKRTENREPLILSGVNKNVDAAGNVSYETNQTPIEAQAYYQAIGGQETAVAEEFVYDASFIRLKELSVGYSLPSSLLRKTPLSQVRFSLVGRNLCYLMKHTPGTSPEGGFDTSMFSQAIDFSSLPYSRTFGFTINLGF